MKRKKYSFEEQKDFYNAINRLRDQGMKITQACRQLDSHWSRYYKARNIVTNKHVRVKDAKKISKNSDSSNKVIYYDSKSSSQSPLNSQSDSITLKIDHYNFNITVMTTPKSAAQLIKEL